VPSFNYVPIEGDDLPPFWRSIWDTVTPVAMSGFGQTQLQKLLARPVPMVPHGVSDGFFQVSSVIPGRWKGSPITSKEAAKAAIGVAGRTVLLRTDRFNVRKDYPALFHALVPVFAAHPEVLLVVHCAPDDEGGHMGELISHLPGSYVVDGRWAHPQVKLTSAHDTFRGLADEELNVLYNAADIYLSPTMAEGFGLTLAEAAACGVPVVTTDFAAGPEAVGPGAVLVKPRTLHTNVYAHNWALVDEGAFGDAVEHLVSHPAKRRDIGAAGKRYVAGRFTWDKAAADFLDLFGYQRAAAA
jgi:glycosyltransferase involved in cell wall biosynthesis